VFDPSAIADLKAQVASSEMTPPLSENSMGNLFWIAAARYVAESKPGLGDWSEEWISKIDDDFVKQLKGNEGSYANRHGRLIQDVNQSRLKKNKTWLTCQVSQSTH
jgi:hypothetical protein